MRKTARSVGGVTALIACFALLGCGSSSAESPDEEEGQGYILQSDLEAEFRTEQIDRLTEDGDSLPADFEIEVDCLVDEHRGEGFNCFSDVTGGGENRLLQHRITTYPDGTWSAEFAGSIP